MNTSSCWFSGVGRRVVGKAVSGHVSPDGAHTTLLEYLIWKYSTGKILPQEQAVRGTGCESW